MRTEDQITNEVEDFQEINAVELFVTPRREIVDRLVRITQLADIARGNNTIPKKAVLRNIQMIANGISH